MMNPIDAIREFVHTDLLDGPQAIAPSDDTNLIELGIIDSFSVMLMLSFLEEQFSIEFSNEDLIPENFLSISAIAAITDRYLSR